MLLVSIACADKKDPVITIVNIGQTNRIQLGRQLGIIKQFSPKVIALDFYLVPDSLDKDIVLVHELETIKNTVQIVGLHHLHERSATWDSLEISHPKFKIANHGFANLSTEDSVIINALPMAQTFHATQIQSFSYAIAQNSFGVKNKFKNTGNKELKLNLDTIGKNYQPINADDLLSGNFRKQDLNDKIVIMGYLGEKEDFFYLDHRKTKRVNGVEIHAAIVEEILDL
jgi:CHASE2 domain-containing sensor protein